MRLLAIDYGKVRIGIAVSDNGLMARPLCTIKNKGDKKNIDAIRNILGTVRDIPPDIVIGLPLHPDGNETPMSLEIRRFGKLIESELGVTVIFHNERHSSQEAEHYIRTVMGVTKPDKIKELLDFVSATVILNSYIQSCGEGNK